MDVPRRLSDAEGSTPVIAVVGSTGFIGSQIVDRLRSRGHAVVCVRAPRLSSQTTTVPGIRREALESPAVAELSARLDGTDVVVNAAGTASAGARLDRVLLGSNALLPSVIQLAAAKAGCTRLVHVSSAAVQGSGRLDETSRVEPLSPYSFTKSLGELALRSDEIGTVIYRPTSVHGTSRSVTAALARFARSRWSSVVGDGERPTPQILVQNVAQALEALAFAPAEVPAIALHPWEGLSVRELLVVLGLGKEPLDVPASLARPALSLATAAGLVTPRAGSTARRLEMLWLGQEQEPGWLHETGFSPEFGLDEWRSLARRLAGERNLRPG